MSRDFELQTDDGGMWDQFDFGMLTSEVPVQQATEEYTENKLYGISNISDGQENVLSVLQICSAIMSLIGSCTIVFKILRSLYQNQTTTPYDRIMLGLSSCDIVASCVYAISPFLVPKETSQRPWAMGSASTCNTLGMLTQLAALWSIWYNCLLSFYYLLTVRYQVKREVFVKKYEIGMHLSGAIFFPITALAGYWGEWYGEQALIIHCWIVDVPTGCDSSGKCSGNATEIVSYMFGALPMAITFLSLIINNIVIYLFVRKSLLSSPPQSDDRSEASISITDLDTSISSNGTDARSVQQRLTKETATQGLLYVVTFLISSSPIFALEYLEGSVGLDEDDKATLYPLLVLNSMLVPLQGFFNVFIYIRPTYNRFRDAHPEKPLWVVLKQALFDPNIPRMNVGVSVMPKPTTAKRTKSSKLNSKSGSNFSMSLENIMEEEGSDSMDGDVRVSMDKDASYSGEEDETISVSE